MLFALDHQYDKLKWFQEWAHGMGFPVTMDEVALKPEDLPACAAKAADGSVAEWGKWPYEVTEQDFVDAIVDDAPVRVTGHDGKMAVRLVYMGLDSLLSGSIVHDERHGA